MPLDDTGLYRNNPSRRRCHVGEVFAKRDAITTKTKSLYHGHRFPATVISHAVRRYFRFVVSLRDIEEMLLERGMTVIYETIRRWCEKFGAGFSDRVRATRRKPRSTSTKCSSHCVANRSETTFAAHLSLSQPPRGPVLRLARTYQRDPLSSEPQSVLDCFGSLSTKSPKLTVPLRLI
jgi:hypothetical protein